MDVSHGFLSCDVASGTSPAPLLTYGEIVDSFQSAGRAIPDRRAVF